MKYNLLFTDSDRKLIHLCGDVIDVVLQEDATDSSRQNWMVTVECDDLPSDHRGLEIGVTYPVQVEDYDRNELKAFHMELIDTKKSWNLLIVEGCDPRRDFEFNQMVELEIAAPDAPDKFQRVIVRFQSITSNGKATFQMSVAEPMIPEGVTGIRVRDPHTLLFSGRTLEGHTNDWSREFLFKVIGLVGELQDE